MLLSLINRNQSNGVAFIIDRDNECPNGATLLGKYVAVRYQKNWYTGIVEDFDKQDVLVRCMNKLRCLGCMLSQDIFGLPLLKTCVGTHIHKF